MCIRDRRKTKTTADFSQGNADRFPKCSRGNQTGKCFRHLHRPGKNQGIIHEKADCLPDSQPKYQDENFFQAFPHPLSFLSDPMPPLRGKVPLRILTACHFRDKGVLSGGRSDTFLCWAPLRLPKQGFAHRAPGDSLPAPESYLFHPDR